MLIHTLEKYPQAKTENFLRFLRFIKTVEQKRPQYRE